MGGSGIRRSLPFFSVVRERAQGASNPLCPSGRLILKIAGRRAQTVKMCVSYRPILTIARWRASRITGSPQFALQIGSPPVPAHAAFRWNVHDPLTAAVSLTLPFNKGGLHGHANYII